MAEDGIDHAALYAAPFEVPEAHARVYRKALRALARSRVPFVVSGAHAMASYTGHIRNTKDLDVFFEAKHLPGVRRALELAGFVTEVRDSCWLAKAWLDSVYVDLIFAAGNLVAVVDATWIARSQRGHVLGVPVRFASPEDLVSWKTFICERHRFDGADIAHIIHARKGKLDWRYLIARMGEHWELLLWHLVFFRYVYPSHGSYVPRWVMDELLSRYERLLDAPDRKRAKLKPFRGTLVSSLSFQGDVAKGYRDAREERRRLIRTACG